MEERGATEDEVTSTVEAGERFEAKFDRVGFRRNFSTVGKWRGKKYNTKQMEVYAVSFNPAFSGTIAAMGSCFKTGTNYLFDKYAYIMHINAYENNTQHR